MGILLFFILTTVLYLVLIGTLVYGFDKVEEFTLQDLSPKNKFTIVVVFRNEEHHLPRLLDSFENLDYPTSLFEILMVDDFSDDNSREIISKFKINNKLNIRVLENLKSEKSPKKTGIELAISKSEFPWIITTDADCIVPVYWLAAYDEYIQKHNPDFLIGPVKYIEGNSILSKFQLMDNLSLQGATIGGFGINKPFLCNGANLCYNRELFENVGGFMGNEDIASGDDIFLLQKAIKSKIYKVGCIKCYKAIVETLSENSLGKLLNQRARWAGKTRNYKRLFPKFIGITALMMNMGLLLGLILIIATTFPLRIFLYILIIKTGIDFLLIFKTARFFKVENSLPFYPVAAVFYPLFTVMVILKTLVGGYHWKERRFSTHKG